MPANFKIPWKVLTIERTHKKSEVLYKYFLIVVGEILGTASLLFYGCAALSSVYGESAAIMNVCVYFGMIVALIVQLFLPISGGHINPTVSICLYVFGHLSIPMLVTYAISQIIGSLIGYSLMRAICPSSILQPGENYCTTDLAAGVSPLSGFFIEFIISAFLIALVCSMIDPRNKNLQDSFPIKVGIAIWVMAYIGAPYTGGSMNMARTLGPAIYNNHWDNIWIYCTAPALASLLTSLFYWMFLMDNPVEDKEGEEK